MRFRVRLICCGRDDGYWDASTWEEAEEFRLHYVKAGRHDRSAIVEAVPDDDSFRPGVWVKP